MGPAATKGNSIALERYPWPGLFIKQIFIESQLAAFLGAGPSAADKTGKILAVMETETFK